MKRIQFKCTLLSDVILSINAATEGKQESLDFIPGGCFLGIAAASLYGEKNSTGLDDADLLLAFHSGKVRFGDAHPVKGGAGSLIRSERIPAVYFHDKLKKETEGCVIYYQWEDDPKVQMKQCRSGFFAFDGTARTFTKVNTPKNVSIKSAYDKDRRRSKDEAMFSYEALSEGTEFVFEIEFDTEAEHLETAITQSLEGIRHIGRSKTAQYGLVKIEKTDFIQCESIAAEACIATVYADGRLIFIDGNGMPAFKPSAQDLGFADGAEIEWKHSQIRTFQYAPWNAKRHNRDCDRCGIEKGSVFVVNLHGTPSPKETAYIGSYKNEGFGRVIYNPEFLLSKKGTNAETLFKAVEDAPGSSNGEKSPHKTAIKESRYNKALLSKIESLKNTVEGGTAVYEIVNKFVRDHQNEFSKEEERFASQWGHIRELANTSADKGDFKKKVTEYLGHGVAKDKWKYKKDILTDFIEKEVTDGNWRQVMVNLSAEMAKKCKRQ